MKGIKKFFLRKKYMNKIKYHSNKRDTYHYLKVNTAKEYRWDRYCYYKSCEKHQDRMTSFYEDKVTRLLKNKY